MRVLTLSSGKAQAVLMPLDKLALTSVRYRLTHRWGGSLGELDFVDEEKKEEEGTSAEAMVEEAGVDVLLPPLLLLLLTPCGGMM